MVIFFIDYVTDGFSKCKHLTKVLYAAESINKGEAKRAAYPNPTMN